MPVSNTSMAAVVSPVDQSHPMPPGGADNTVVSPSHRGEGMETAMAPLNAFGSMVISRLKLFSQP